MAYSAAVLPADGDAPIIAEMRKIMSDYAANGVPADLVEAAKRKEIAVPSSGATQFQAWRKLGRRLWPQKGGIRPMTTSRP